MGVNVTGGVWGCFSMKCWWVTHPFMLTVWLGHTVRSWIIATLFTSQLTLRLVTMPKALSVASSQTGKLHGTA